MSISIFISGSRQSNSESSMVAGGTPSMAGLVDPVSEVLKSKYPNIYEKAFESLDWGEVYIDKLNQEEFNLVYKITKEIYLKSPSNFSPESSAMVKNWAEYMKKLEQDPRLENN